MTDVPPLDLDAIEEKIHDAPPCELTPVALALVGEVRRLRAGLRELRKLLIEAVGEE